MGWISATYAVRKSCIVAYRCMGSCWEVLGSFAKKNNAFASVHRLMYLPLKIPAF